MSVAGGLLWRNWFVAFSRHPRSAVTRSFFGRLLHPGHSAALEAELLRGELERPGETSGESRNARGSSSPWIRPWIARRHRDNYSPGRFGDCRPNLQEPRSERSNRRPRKFVVPKDSAHVLEEHVGSRGEQYSKLIRDVARATRTIDLQVAFQFLDPVLAVAALAIEFPGTLRLVSQIRDEKARVATYSFPFCVHDLRLENHPSLAMPRARRVVRLTEKRRCLPEPLGEHLRRMHLAGTATLQYRVFRQSDDVFDPQFLKRVVDQRARKARVEPNTYFGLLEGLA